MKILALFLVLLPNAVFGLSPAAIAKFYNQGKYRRAIVKYKLLIQKNYRRGDVYYNLGNSYYKAGDFVNAIFYYEKAKKSEPLNSNLTVNLNLAKSKAGVTFTYNLERGMFYFLPANLLKWFVFIFTTLSLLSVTLYTLRRKFHFIFFIIFLFTFIVWSLYLYKVNYNTKNKFGIISKGATIYSEPRYEASGIENVKKGARVKIYQEYNNFFRIKINKDLTGWVKKSRIKKL